MSEILNKIDVNDYSIQKIKSQGGGQANLQSKEVTITENGTTTVTADAGYDGLSDVDVTVNVSSQSDYNAKVSETIYVKNSYTNPIIASSIIELPDNLTMQSYNSEWNFIFQDFKNLKKAPNIIMNEGTANHMNGMFQNCEKLEDVPVYDTQYISQMSNMFQNCNSLTNNALNNILQMCINATYANTKTLKYIGLSSSQATTCQSLSNWDAFVEAGWTSGY